MLIFRYDDFSAAQRMSLAVEELLFDVFRKRHLPLTLGVTPCMAEDVHDPTCQELAELGRDQHRLGLLRRGLDLGWEVALHGLTHRCSAIWDGTEFAMVSRRLQSSRMAEGRERLSGWLPRARIRTFIPPWNTFDATTVEVAASHQFDVLCGGAEAVPGVRSGVRIVPSVISADELISYAQILSVPRLLADLGGSTLVVTFHEYEFRIDDAPDWARLAALDETIAQLSAAEVRWRTASAALPAACRLTGRSDFQANLSLIRRLKYRACGDLTQAFKIGTGAAARQRASTLFRAAAAAASRIDQLRRATRERLVPVRQSMVRARAMAKGRMSSGLCHSCPLCGYEGTFGPSGQRPHAQCPSCASLEGHRFIAAAIGPMLAERAHRRRALVLGSGPLPGILRAAFDHVAIDDTPTYGGGATFSLQRVPFRADSLDLVLAVDVLDEVEDDVSALAECWRTLSPGGWLIAPVVIHGSGDTQELGERRADGKIRLAGDDYLARIRAQGFVQVATLDPLDARYAALHTRHNIRPPTCRPGSHSVVIFQKERAAGVVSVHDNAAPSRSRTRLVGGRERQRNAETSSNVVAFATAASRR